LVASVLQHLEYLQAVHLGHVQVGLNDLSGTCLRGTKSIQRALGRSRHRYHCALMLAQGFANQLGMAGVVLHDQYDSHSCVGLIDHRCLLLLIKLRNQLAAQDSNTFRCIDAQGYGLPLDR
jgi:hypothetical protein